MKKIIAIAVCIAAVLILNACVPTEKTEINAAPEKLEGPVEFDFVQIHNDVMTLFEGCDMYAFVNDLDISGDNRNKTVTVTAVIPVEMDDEAHNVFAAAVLRRISDAAAFQDYRISGSSDQDMGGFWKEFGCQMTFYADTENGEQGEILREIVFGAGEEIGISPNTSDYEEEWLREYEILKRNAE